MNRIGRLTLLIAGLAASWLLMQAVHELGHVLAAWATGGSVQRVVLNPLTISRTDVSPNPHPLAVVWAGPLVGVVLPAAIAVACRSRRPLCLIARLFAGFCLIANGLYIGVGSIEGIGDAGDMLRHGSPRWLLIAFGVAAASAGLWLWHSLGPLSNLWNHRPTAK